MIVTIGEHPSDLPTLISVTGQMKNVTIRVYLTAESTINLHDGRLTSAMNQDYLTVQGYDVFLKREEIEKIHLTVSSISSFIHIFMKNYDKTSNKVSS